MSIIGVPNKYEPLEWVMAKVADQSELPTAMQEMANDGYMPLQMAFGKLDSKIAIKPTFYVVGWRVKPEQTAKEAAKVTL